jgi:serine/threonine-protein kinase SRPK3
MKVHADKAGHRELEVFLRLGQDHSEHIVSLLDHFELTGPNGKHLCLVLELMWADAGSFMGGQYNWPEIRTTVAKEVSKQLLKGIEDLNKIGVRHNGCFFIKWLTLDLRPQNYLLTFDNRAMSVQELLKVENSTDQDHLEGVAYEDPNGVWVIYHSRPLSLVSDGEPVDLGKMKVKIADFGKASFDDDSNPEYGDRTVVAPEVLLGCSWDCRADVWSLGVSVSSLQCADLDHEYAHRRE